MTKPHYAKHHYREDGSLIVGEFGPWRTIDLMARAAGFHCWECMRSFANHSPDANEIGDKA